MWWFYKPWTRVKVINPGEQYSTYDRMADTMGLTKYVSGSYGTGQNKWNHGEIVAVKKHFEDSCYLYWVRMDNWSEILIGTGWVTVKGTTSKPQSTTPDPDQSAAITKLQRETLVAWSKELADWFIIMQSKLEKQLKIIELQAEELSVMKDHIYQLEQRVVNIDNRVIELEFLQTNN